MGGSGNFRGGFNNSSNAAANPMMANPAMGMMRGGGGMMNPNLLGGMMTAAGLGGMMNGMSMNPMAFGRGMVPQGPRGGMMGGFNGRGMMGGGGMGMGMKYFSLSDNTSIHTFIYRYGYDS